MDCVERGAHTVVCEISTWDKSGLSDILSTGAMTHYTSNRNITLDEPSPYSIFMVLWVRGRFVSKHSNLLPSNHNKRGITKDKRINGKSLRETETNGKSPTTPPREIPIWKQKLLLLKSLRKYLFHYYYSSHYHEE